jgi:carboxyl-terminal processing protease
MGRRSFGKGSVQTILPMNNKAALKLTTARYFTPAGRSIQAEGIKPDIVIDKVRVAKIGSDDNQAVKEADLDRHLEKPDEAKPASAAQDDAQDSAREPPLAERDYELYEALNMLKGMALLSTRRESK